MQTPEMNTLHKIFPWRRASGGDRQRQLIDSDAVSDGQGVDALVRRFAGEDFPQKDSVAPHVGSLGEGRRFDDLGSHPRISARRRHSRRLVHFTRQPEIGDLQCLEQQVVVLDRFSYQYYIHKKKKNRFNSRKRKERKTTTKQHTFSSIDSIHFNRNKSLSNDKWSFIKLGSMNSVHSSHILA